MIKKYSITKNKELIKQECITLVNRFHKNSTKFLLLLIFSGISHISYSQFRIQGKVIDKKTNEALVGAVVVINGLNLVSVSDVNGNYIINDVPTGSHTLSCSYISYEELQQQIFVKKNEPNIINLRLASSDISLGTVTISAKRNLELETALQSEHKTLIVVNQTIGAQELSRKGVSDAEGAVTKISGVSKQEGVKNVFVRGLGDRYNTTTLNGFILPSEDPEYKNISLDFFSNDIIQNVSVNKVFSASMTGDVGGALINIKSKELLCNKELSVGASSSLNMQTIGKKMLIADGLNSFGYSNASFGPYQQLNTYSFNTSLDPTQPNNPYNLDFSIAGGKKFLNKHSFYIVGATGNKYKYEEGGLRDITATNASNPYMDMTYTKFSRNTTQLILGNCDFNFTNLKLSYNSLYIHSGSAYHSEIYGKSAETFQVAEEFNSEGLVRREQINDNSIFVNQAIVEGNASKKLKYFAGVSVNVLSGKEPDRRIFKLPSVGNGMVQLATAENRNERFNTKINEQAINPKAHIRYKFNEEKVSFIEFGIESKISNKNFEAPLYTHVWNPLLPSPIFDKDNVNLDEFIYQQSLLNNDYSIEYFNDTYTVSKSMNGVYVDAIYEINKHIVVNGGIRGDYIFSVINYDVNRGANIGSDTLQGLHISPSVNVKYTLNEKHNIRFGTSKTYTLPQDKEISPFVYRGFDGNENGNPNLTNSTNYNVDLRWDFYISNKEMLSVNGFYKYILDPIARVDQGNSAGIKTFDNVSDNAIAGGIELELKKCILTIPNTSELNTTKHALNVGLNASYIYSNINLDPKIFAQNTTSTLEGSAPYIVNGDISYNLTLQKVKLTSAIIVNFVSDKVHTIGTRGYNNLIEEKNTTLDFANKLTINKKIDLGFKAMNILNQDYNLSRKGKDSSIPAVLIKTYKKGMSLHFSITYKLQ